MINIDSLQSKYRTLADSLKVEKSKSRTAMEQLLIATTTQTQTNKLIASFQDRFNKLQNDNNTFLHKLQRTTESQLYCNQTSIEHSTTRHNKQFLLLESAYCVSLVNIENNHNKAIASLTTSHHSLRNKLSKMKGLS